MHQEVTDLFRRMRLGQRAWINLPLAGIGEAADLSEIYAREHITLFWNTPNRKKALSDNNFVSVTINRLKLGNREERQCALHLIELLEQKNADFVSTENCTDPDKLP